MIAVSRDLLEKLKSSCDIIYTLTLQRRSHRLMMLLQTCFLALIWLSCVAVDAVDNEEELALNDWKGIRIWYSYNVNHSKSYSAPKEPFLDIRIAGGWRVKRASIEQWLSSTPDVYNDEKVYYHISEAFYEHMRKYLELNGFDETSYFYYPEFSNRPKQDPNEPGPAKNEALHGVFAIRLVVRHSYSLH